MTPLKSIRKMCLDCSGGKPSGVRACPTTDCPLWPYRMGRNPKRTGIGGKRKSPELPQNPNSRCDSARLTRDTTCTSANLRR